MQPSFFSLSLPANTPRRSTVSTLHYHADPTLSLLSNKIILFIAASPPNKVRRRSWSNLAFPLQHNIQDIEHHLAILLRQAASQPFLTSATTISFAADGSAPVVAIA